VDVSLKLFPLKSEDALERAAGADTWSVPELILVPPE
jgi:hypothetical protein